MVLVIGGSGSGKSAYAEERTDSCFKENNPSGMSAPQNVGIGNKRKYYLATMQVFDEEGRRKVERHRELRAGKGFVTVEQPTDIHQALDKMAAGERTVLLECISNLTANEMFSDKEVKLETETADKIIREIEMLQKETTHLIVVSNNVFEDGISYDESAMAYIRAMGAINQKLAAMADQVVEVVAGIPVTVKKNIEADDKTGKGLAVKMRLVIGGYAQGKLNYVLQKYHPQTDTMIIDHLHDWVRQRILDGGCPEEEIMSFVEEFEECIIISDEIGNGIVPVDPMEREYRERMGRILIQLADRAERVERVICGIGQTIK